MKTKTLLLLIASIMCQFSFSQEKATTTEEEYNYLTIGYEQQIKTGGDMKSGYKLVPIGKPVTASGYTVERYFLKTNEDVAKAVFIIAKKEKGEKDKLRYLCLPFNNSDLMKKFYNDVSALGITMMEIVEVAVFDLASKSCEKVANGCK